MYLGCVILTVLCVLSTESPTHVICCVVALSAEGFVQQLLKHVVESEIPAAVMSESRIHRKQLGLWGVCHADRCIPSHV